MLTPSLPFKNDHPPNKSLNKKIPEAMAAIPRLEKTVIEKDQTVEAPRKEYLQQVPLRANMTSTYTEYKHQLLPCDQAWQTDNARRQNADDDLQDAFLDLKGAKKELEKLLKEG